MASALKEAVKYANADKGFFGKNMKLSHEEGPVAKAIEEQTAKLPSDLFLWGGLGALVTAASLFYNGKKEEALLVGQWAAPILILGFYNKVVKLEGHD